MTTSQITIIGNLTSDPELRFTPSGHAVASFTVAVNERKKQGDQWVDDGASYYVCQAWRDYAEHVTESLVKGDNVIVTGGLKQRHYETNAGEKRSTWEIWVDEVGPTLRWATAKPVKTGSKTARSGWGGAAAAPAPDPWATSDVEPPF